MASNGVGTCTYTSGETEDGEVDWYAVVVVVAAVLKAATAQAPAAAMARPRRSGRTRLARARPRCAHRGSGGIGAIV